MSTGWGVRSRFNRRARDRFHGNRGVDVVDVDRRRGATTTRFQDSRRHAEKVRGFPGETLAGYGGGLEPGRGVSDCESRCWEVMSHRVVSGLILCCRCRCLGAVCCLGAGAACCLDAVDGSSGNPGVDGGVSTVADRGNPRGRRLLDTPRRATPSSVGVDGERTSRCEKSSVSERCGAVSCAV